MAKSKAPRVNTTTGSSLAAKIGRAMSRPIGKGVDYRVEGTRDGWKPNPATGDQDLMAPNNSTVNR